MTSATIAVIGAGPAGLSAALWLKNLGLRPVVIEREAKTGGMQNFNFLQNDWVLGQLASTGLQMANSFDQHINEKAIDIRLQREINSIIPAAEGGFTLSLQKTTSPEKSLPETQKKSQREDVSCDGIILANGTRYVGREIISHVPGVDQLEDKAVIEGPYAFADMQQCQNKRVLIVGAGDNAFENAAMLLQQGCHVTVVARSTPKARSQFIDQVVAHPHAIIMENASVLSIKKNNVTDIEVVVRSDGIVKNCQKSSLITRTMLIDKIHILAGYCSNADTVSSLVLSGVGESLHCDDSQFLIIDRMGRTSIPYVYAAGDVCNTDFPCVVSAIASGALAAKTASQDLLG
jgi:thioredoxin reductase